jgi:hypothetical protein
MIAEYILYGNLLITKGKAPLSIRLTPIYKELKNEATTEVTMKLPPV